MQGVLGQMWSSGTFWLMSLILVVICILPDLIIKGYRDLTDRVYQEMARTSQTRRCGVSCCKCPTVSSKHVRDTELTKR